MPWGGEDRLGQMKERPGDFDVLPIQGNARMLLWEQKLMIYQTSVVISEMKPRRKKRVIK